jgi:hypothetical protein
MQVSGVVQVESYVTHTVCGRVVDSDWCATDTYAPLGACGYVDVIVTSSVMRNVLQAVWQI